ncbi:MAG TPA: ATP-binding protein [Methylomirabilota bacterium]|nr:ATP-binding protein [Methylomirabilota bacterium]
MSMTAPGSASTAGVGFPDWARKLADLYESNAASQFVVYGNISDRMVLPVSPSARLGSISDFLLEVLLPRFDVVLSYDIGNGIRVDKGGELFSKWPHFQESQRDWKAPRAAVETLTRYFRYCANLTRLNQPAIQVGCVIKNADLLVPGLQGGLDYDLNALASLIRDWSSDALLANHALASFLLTENLNDLHPLIVNNPRVARAKVDLPAPTELLDGFRIISSGYPTALADFESDLPGLAEQLSGATLGAIESIVKTKEHRKERLAGADLAKIKKDLVERDTNGLIEFIETKRTLDDLYGIENVKKWLRQDIELWTRNDIAALPKGYLLCGPVGTGKTFLVECLAGEASVPIVKMKNFRDKWVGSSEGNLEKIFRLIHALGRCYVFIDEADQALGKRDGSSGDSGVGGRIYSMLAEEMGSSKSRGQVIWVLASSRPDLIEVDLKRPGRVDVKIPLFPTVTAKEGFDLLSMVAKKKGLVIPESMFASLESRMPLLLTPGAAEALAMNLYRQVRTSNAKIEDVLGGMLAEYQNPIAPDVMAFQIQLAVKEASALEFVPAAFRTTAKA